jgi:hypothetical protein
MFERRIMTSKILKTRVWMAAAAGTMCVGAGVQPLASAAPATEATVAPAGVSYDATVNPSQSQLTEAVQAFLLDHGDLCMAKYTWPRDVTPGDEHTDSNDEVQLPVLERLGVVKSKEIPPLKKTASQQDMPTGPTRRYSLTAKGRQYYLKKSHTILGPHDTPTEHDADFCVAHLTLDKVVKWAPPEPAHNHLETVVRYTYHIKAADWMSDPEAQKVFPIVDRIIRGDGSMLMAATVALQDGKWVPVLPGQ